MKVDEFNKLKEEFLKAEGDLLDSKRMEYAGLDDVLKNFKEQAEFAQVDAKDIALVFLFKHMQGIREIVTKGTVNWSWTTEDGTEGTKQRLSDARNYLLLLAALIEEEQ